MPRVSHEPLLLTGMSHESSHLPEWDPPSVGGAELVTVAQPRVPSAGLGCSWLQPGLPAAVGAQSWYNWIPANDLGLLKATSGAGINK